MSAIIPFDFAAPATRGSRRPNSINLDAMIASAGFPVISIKGKTFAIVKDGERRVLTREIDDEQVPVASLTMAVVRANARARVFYGKAYVEGDSEGAKPTCFSHDGQTPDAQAETPQSNNCQLCPHAQWGTKVSADGLGKGTACTVNTRLAVTDPKNPEVVYLLRVPAGSRTNFSDAVKLVDSHGKDYNEVQMRISFDQDAPSPKLVFKPTGILSDDTFAKIEMLSNDPTVRDIVGVPSLRVAQEVAPRVAALAAPVKTPVVTDDEIQAPLAGPKAEEALAKVMAPARPRAAAVKPAPVAAPVKATAPAADASGLLADLNSLLGASDD